MPMIPDAVVTYTPIQILLDSESSAHAVESNQSSACAQDVPRCQSLHTRNSTTNTNSPLSVTYIRRAITASWAQGNGRPLAPLFASIVPECALP